MSGRLGELLIILVIVFIFFGAGKLPKVMAELGKGVKGLKKDKSLDDDTLDSEEEGKG